MVNTLLCRLHGHTSPLGNAQEKGAVWDTAMEWMHFPGGWKLPWRADGTLFCTGVGGA